MQAHILFGIRIVPWFKFCEDMNEHVMTCCNVENSSKSTSFEKPEIFRFEEKDRYSLVNVQRVQSQGGFQWHVYGGFEN